MANVAGTGGAGGSAYGRPRPPAVPNRKAAIDKLVTQSFTATGKGQSVLAKRFKAMNLSPDELDYVKQSSGTRGAAARHKADPWGDMVANALQFGINPHVFQHPIARLEGKGQFAPTDTVAHDAAGKPIKGYASMVPWLGGGEGQAAEEITSAVKPRVFPVVRDPITGRPGLANPAGTAADYHNLMPRGEHLYHSTSESGLARIRKEGLQPGKARKGEVTGVYFAEDGTSVTSLRPDSARTGDVLLRVKRSNVQTETTDMYEPGSGFEEHVSRDPVPASHLEYLGADGGWHPLPLPKPHPLTAGKPTVQKIVPTAKTLGETASEGLQGAKGLRATQEKLRSLERGSRAREYAKELQANPTMAGHQRASQLLAGELPKMKFGGFQDFTPETLDAMTRAVADHPDLQPFTQKRAIDALGKIHAGKVPTKGEEKILRQVFGPEVVKEMKQAVSKFHQVKSIAYDVGNLPRSVMASFDASGVLRQALLIATGNPRIWARNVPSYLKAIKSEDVYTKGMEALHSRPNAVNGVYEKMGVDLTEMTPRGQAASREESFRSPFAEKIPGIRMSGRGFTLFLDNARADLADHLYAKAVSQGRDVNDSHLLESIGDVVNSSSGRGDLGEGAIGRSQEGLNLLLFSPRLIKSRIDFLNPVWYAKLDPLARHQAYKAMGGLAVLMLTALSIAREAGAKVNLDPRSSDFAKIRMGNTRVDLAGGFQQYIRLLSELATQQTVNTAGVTSHLGRVGPGKTSDFDLLFRFFRSKLAPLASAGVDISQRQNTVGQPITWQNQIGSRLTPLSGQDALSVGEDAAKSTGSTSAGVLAGVGAFGLSAFGGGVQNYTPKPVAASRKKPRDYGGGSSYRSPYGRSSSGGSAYGKRP